MLGLGKTTPWEIESAPPTVPPATIEVPELFAYIPVTKKQGAIKVDKAGPDTTIVDGQFYKLVDFTRLEDIRLNSVRNIYLEAELNHNLITVESFRSLGVHVEIEYAGGVSLGQPLYAWGELVGKLYYVENFRPIAKVDNLTQTFKLVINGY